MKEHLDKEGKQFAAKIINVQNILSGKEQHLFMRESSILCKLKHPAIVKFYGINFHSFEDHVWQISLNRQSERAPSNRI